MPGSGQMRCAGAEPAPVRKALIHLQLRRREGGHALPVALQRLLPPLPHEAAAVLPHLRVAMRRRRRSVISQALPTPSGLEIEIPMSPLYIQLLCTSSARCSAAWACRLAHHGRCGGMHDNDLQRHRAVCPLPARTVDN
jgi:hypothetical protein